MFNRRATAASARRAVRAVTDRHTAAPPRLERSCGTLPPGAGPSAAFLMLTNYHTCSPRLMLSTGSDSHLLLHLRELSVKDLAFKQCIERQYNHHVHIMMYCMQEAMMMYHTANLGMKNLDRLILTKRGLNITNWLLLYITWTYMYFLVLH